jgi:hypothetical protein
MDHAITVKEVVVFVLVVGGLIGAVALLFGLLALFNPFRSGH